MLIDRFKQACTLEQWEAGEGLLRSSGLGRNISDSEACFEIPDNGTVCHVRVTAVSVDCDCGADICAHRAAALLYCQKNGILTDLEIRWSARSENVISEAWKKAHMSSELRLVPVLQLKDRQLYLLFRIGDTKLYSVSAAALLSARREGRELPVKDDLAIGHDLLWFGDREELLLNVLEGASKDSYKGKWLRLGEGLCGAVLDRLDGLDFEYRHGTRKKACRGIPQWSGPLRFSLTGNMMKAVLSVSLPEGFILFEHGRFICAGDSLWAVDRHDRPLYDALASLSEGGSEVSAVFTSDQRSVLFHEIVPWLEGRHELTIDPELKNKLENLDEMRGKVFLDVSHGDIIAEIHFVYGRIDINPFRAADQAPVLLLRNGTEEERIMAVLADAGFRVRKGLAYLDNSEQIFAFLKERLPLLQGSCEVYMSRDFERIIPRKPRFHGVMRSETQGFRLELLDDDVPVPLIPIMEALAKKKKYFRLADGSFILLDDIRDWENFVEAVNEGHSGGNGRFSDFFEYYKAPWISSLISKNKLPWKADEKVTDIINFRTEVPEPDMKGMHPYQVRGFEWLYTLHKLGMGGILADEMGLGKTIQAIAVILQMRNEDEEKMPSLIVAPTSLTYNWYSEFKQFAPSLEAFILQGPQDRRRKDLELCMNASQTDVVLTSYPILRRDASLLARYRFRFVILDEAQEVKNAMTLAAHAVRCLQAQTRFALTGTPLENHIGELWSIFDFILPDYLPSYSVFMSRWGKGEGTQELYERIRPFFMRRLKKDVLEELPPKMEHRIMVRMTPDQKDVYTAALFQKNERVHQVLNEKGLRDSRGDILRAITELREICCHPRLCLPETKADSGKIELLLSLIPKALESGNRFLIFTQFRGILSMLEERLRDMGIVTMMIHGETPADERKNLTDRFNSGEGQVFLISLKAGGTGLNLTGADIVVHFEPWWNPNVEDQADGRAHRIGQTRPVDVWKLILADTIEEKIVALGRSKRELFDQLIRPGETFPTGLKTEELLKLFEPVRD